MLTVPQNHMGEQNTQSTSALVESLATHLQQIRDRISTLAKQAQRPTDSVSLLAISKWQSVDAIRTLAQLGQLDFGENYLQEALSKQAALSSVLGDISINWHFTGHIQSNKTRAVAENFLWAHTVDRFKIAQRLSEQRPQNLPPLNVCIQVKWVDEPGKGGVWPTEVPALAQQIAGLPRVKLRGLMCLPPPSEDFVEQRRYFDQTAALLKQLNDSALSDSTLSGSGLSLDTLSMGTSSDLAAAIAAGATIVRVGTAIFGERLEK